MKQVRRNKPLWDVKQLEANQFFSYTSYFNVKAIDGNIVTVENSWGNQINVSREIVESMHSADHYQREVFMNMTNLAEVLQLVKDNVFTVQFRKNPREEDAAEALEAVNMTDLTDPTKISKLAKEIIEGRLVKKICHMIEVENNLGRSLVIDLTADSENKFRQIDHRSIDFIIFRNVKYTLKKGAKSQDLDEKEDKNAPLWDKDSLRVGNWFSGTRYFKAISDNGEEVICESQG